MTREEIERDLIDRLQSPLWDTVKTSTVGKELISLGVEAIKYSEEVNDSLFTAFDYHTSNRQQLISMSHTYEIPITFDRPDTVTIRYNSPSGQVYPPFSLTLTSGNVTYYNIKACDCRNEVTLYKGVLPSGGSMSNPPMQSIYTGNGVATIDTYDVYNAIPDSVYCYAGQGGSTPMSRYVSSNGNDSTRLAFKFYMKYNGNLSVVRGDGKWAKSANITKIEYLKPTHIPVDVTNATFRINGQDVSKQMYSILSTCDGKVEDIEYARSQFARFYLEKNAVVTGKQIKEFVNAFPDILDCNVMRSAGGTYIYAKPSDSTAILPAYGTIEMELSLHGSLGENYKIDTATPIYFTLVVYGISASNQATVADFLTKKLSYTSLAIDEVPSFSKLSSDIVALVGEAPSFSLRIKNDLVTNGRLSASPLQGSVVTTSSATNAFDINGKLYKYSSIGGSSGGLPSNYVPNSILGPLMLSQQRVDQYLLLTSDDSAYRFSENFSGGSAYTDARTFGQYGYAFYPKDAYSSYYGVDAYNINDISIQSVIGKTLNKIASFTIPSAYALTSSTSSFCYMHDSYGLKAFVKPSGSSKAFVYFYNSDSPVSYHFKPLGSASGSIKGIAKSGDSVYCFIGNGSSNKYPCSVINGINTSVETVSYTTFKLPNEYAAYDIMRVSTFDNGMIAFVCKDTPSTSVVLLADGFIKDTSDGSMKPIGVVASSQVPCNGIVTFGNNFVDISAGGGMDPVYRVSQGEDGSLTPVEYGTVTFYGESSLLQIGSVNYNTGEVSITDGVAYNFNYDTNTVKSVSSSQYLRLDDTVPVDFR